MHSAGLGWGLMYMAQSLGCWAGDRMRPVWESSAPTVGPGKLTSSMGRETIALSVI